MISTTRSLFYPIFGLALLLTGCGASLKPDPNPYAVLSNVPTAEFEACGSKAQGLKICTLERGRPLNDVGLAVQGYYRGTVRVTSAACGIDQTYRYDKSSLDQVFLTGVVREECLIAIVVAPEYPRERKSAVEIGTLEAFVWVKPVSRDDAHLKYISVIPSDYTARISIPSKSGRVIMRGCDADVNEQVNAIDGSVTLSLSMLPARGMGRCVYEGAIVTEDKTQWFTWLVWKHSKLYVPASIPVIEEKGGKLLVVADAATTVLSLDSEAKIAAAAKFSFDPAVPHILRALTVAGRNMIGLYDPKGGWRWLGK